MICCGFRKRHLMVVEYLGSTPTKAAVPRPLPRLGRCLQTFGRIFRYGDGTVYGWLKSAGKSWQYSLGAPWRGGPLVAKRKIYLLSDHGLHCLGLNGKKLWSAAIAATVVQNALAVNAGHCFVGTADGLVYCFDAVTGHRVWRYDVGGVVTPRFWRFQAMYLSAIIRRSDGLIAR